MRSVPVIKGFFGRNKAVFVMGLLALVIAGTADLFAGLLLENMEEYLLLIPGMMVLIYTAIGMRGNIFGALGSRLGTAMHMGTFQMNFHKGGVLRANLEAAIALTMTLSAAMGFTTWIVATLIFNGTYGLLDFMFISSLGGFLSGFVVMGFNILIAYEGFKRDWDVDNITAPLIAAVGDIVTMPLIFFSAWLFLNVQDTSIGELAVSIIALAFVAGAIAYSYKIFKAPVSKRDFSGEAKRIVKQSIPVLLFCLIFEIGAGIVIQNEQEKLIEYAVIIIMLTAFLNEGNALSGMLTSRLSSSIHLGTIEPKMYPSRGAMENFLIMYICATLTFVYIGILAYFATTAIGSVVNVSLGTSVLIIVVAGLLATTILNILSYYVAVMATRFGMDPDDHCIPITSSVMDLLGSLVLVAVVMLIL